MNLDVHLHAYGVRRHVGKLAAHSNTILFQYAPEFLDSGINISPFRLPLSPEVKEDPKRTFDGLFGVFNDSLPDGWGLLLLDRALRKKGSSLHACLPLQRLAMVGAHGMGALEYTPAAEQAEEAVSVAELMLWQRNRCGFCAMRLWMRGNWTSLFSSTAHPQGPDPKFW